MIKKYNAFLEKFIITKEFNTLSEAFNNFCELISSCQETDICDWSSYSYIAQDNRRRSSDPDVDYEAINKYMSENGFEEETVRRLFKEYTEELGSNDQIITQLYNHCQSGAMDYYLYTFDNSWPLQGHDWDGYENDEYEIKFGYGWHKTKYGMLCINQKWEAYMNSLKKLEKKPHGQ